MSARRFRTAKLLIAAGMVATVLHFADNTFAIERYPGPSWITPFGVAVSWFVVAGVAVFALTRKTPGAPFVAAAVLDALLLLAGLLHYAFAPPSHLAMRSNVTVLAEAVIGVALGAVLLSSRSRATTPS